MMMTTEAIGDDYHGEKETKLRIEIDDISVSENELRFAFLLTDEHDGDLLSGD